MSVVLDRRPGFTLLEILTVLAIMAILGGLVFAATSGMLDKSKRDTASAEMDIIEQALESYKARFGDYPVDTGTYSGTPANAEQFLFNALMGKISPSGGPINVKPMLNYAPLKLANGNYPDPGNSSSVSNWIVDPWGNAYRYQFDPDSSSWTQFGYLLYSAGPDGLYSASSSGENNPSASNNEDNIYAR